MSLLALHSLNGSQIYVSPNFDWRAARGVVSIYQELTHAPGAASMSNN